MVCGIFYIHILVSQHGVHAYDLARIDGNVRGAIGRLGDPPIPPMVHFD